MAQFCTPRPKQGGLGCQASSLEKGQWFPTQGSLTTELMSTVLHILLLANQTYLGHWLQMVGSQFQLGASPAQKATEFSEWDIGFHLLVNRFNATLQFYTFAFLPVNIFWERRIMKCNCSNSFDFWGWTHHNNESAPEVQKSFLYCMTSCFFCFEVVWPIFHLVEWLLKYTVESPEFLHNWVVCIHVSRLFFLYWWKCWSLSVPVCICIISVYHTNRRHSPPISEKLPNLYLLPRAKLHV